MGRYTSAYQSFHLRLKEVELLRRSAAAKERKDPLRLGREIDALCRGSVVLLCGHLEAFIKELGEVALDALFSRKVPRSGLCDRFYYEISKDIIKEIKDTDDPDGIAKKVFCFIGQDLSYWSRVGEWPQQISSDRFNDGFANPAFKKVKAYFNRFGYAEYDHDLATLLAAQYMPTRNMVNHLVDLRNDIAHGDPNAKNTPSDVADMMSIIRLYCRATDDVFANWWKNRFCTLR